MAVIRCLVGVLLVLAAPAAARADGSAARQLLLDAQQAVDDLRYEEAASLLERALATGECRRDELATLYRMSGQLAITVGEDARGERDFIRLFSLHPDAELPRGTSPKIQDRFDAARAQVRERGALDVAIEASDLTVTVTVESDPADMVSSARATWREEGELRALDLQRARKRTYQVELPIAARAEVEVRVTDRHGNALVERRLTLVAPRSSEEVAAATEPPPRARTPRRAAGVALDGERRPEGARRPLFARWPVWAGIAAGFAVGGAVFAVRSRSAQQDLDDLNMDSASHDFQEAASVEDRLRRDSLLANVGFALAAGAGITALAVGVHFEW